MEEVIELLKMQNKTNSTMESCTGGYLANTITNVEGASQVFKFGAVTYANEFKIKMGVNKDIISKYSVYSTETAAEMSKNISKFTDSDIGIGITGELSFTKEKEYNYVYVSIYEKAKDVFVNKKITLTNKLRSLNKEIIIKEIIEELKTILKK